MEWLQKASAPLKNLYLLAAVSLLALMTACGSGGGFDEGAPTTGGGTGGTQPDITISLELVNASDGQPTQTITSANPGRVIATVTGITSPVIVTFSTDVGSIPVPTAITDTNNQATIDILADSALGAGTVTASLSTGESASLVYAVGATNLRMGSVSPFQEGVADVSATQISAGGTATITVSIVDEAGTPFTEPVEVNFSSACSNAPTPTASLGSPITTVNGVASSTYLALGCVGDDAINVTANAGGINLSASTTLNVLSADVGSIEFISASPANIAIQGAGGIGGSESSTLIFRVKDTNDNPVNGQLVNFSLNTGVGGIAINPVSATTNAQGLAQTVINSGTVATTVRVTASIDGSTPLISTQSTNLVVSTGIPDQDSFSLSASTLNPEAWEIDGTEVTVTARLADAYNNPVPDGTAVSFTTEGGSIQSSCTTEGGRCSVIWTSQQPRPEGQYLGDNGGAPQLTNFMGQKYGGRATIVATAIGEESFPDLNGNGRFDAEEVSAFNETNISGEPYDLNEAFVDHNEDGVYNPSFPYAGATIQEEGGELETFMDFNGDQNFTLKDGKYNGVLCSLDANGDPSHAGCAQGAEPKSVNVRASLVLVMAGSEPWLVLSKINGVVIPNPTAENSILTLQGQSTGTVELIISDRHNQQIPAGSEVKFTATIGSVQGSSTFTWPNNANNRGRKIDLSIKGTTQPGTGSLIVEVTTPGGAFGSFTPVSIVVE